MTETTDLFRLYDSDDYLLYIGISNNVDRRLAEIERDCWWWGEVARCEAETYATREEAHKAKWRQMHRLIPFVGGCYCDPGEWLIKCMFRDEKRPGGVPSERLRSNRL